jgi:hypothetical protein
VRLALTLYAVWTGATYALEGAPRTLLRPEAAGLRALYTVVANILIGVIGAGLVLRHLARERRIVPAAAGFRTGRRSALATGIGFVLGAAVYLLQGPPSLDPIILVNGFAQVLPVSAAEVLVCWSVVGAAAEASWRSRRTPTLLAALLASVLFGLYHLAHSPPFNTSAMIGGLTLVGLVTSVFFFVGRDVYGTIVFHNFLALFGVLQALAGTGGLVRYKTLQAPLLITAALAIGLIVAMHRLMTASSD